MDTAIDQISIWTTSHGGRADTFGTFCLSTETLLAALRNAHHKFNDITAVSGRGWIHVGNDASKLRQALQILCFASEHSADYLNLSAEGRLAEDSFSLPGFSIACCTSGNEPGS